jgi:hypothetical protein
LRPQELHDARKRQHVAALPRALDFLPVVMVLSPALVGARGRDAGDEDRDRSGEKDAHGAVLPHPKMTDR